ncbi:MAG: DUF3105 domain-containing protein [Acidimicrobiia bacterium]
MARPKGRGLVKQRQEAADERRRQLAAQSRRKGIIVAAVGLAAAAAAAAFVALQPPPPGIQFPSMGNQHLASPEESHGPYNSSPPSSGPHWGGLANWGEHTEPVPPEIFVHNLEDAGVVLTYDCPDGCADLVEDLSGLLAEFEDDSVLMTPYAGITDPDGREYRAAVVAWTRVFYFDDLDDQTIDEVRQFISLFEGIDHHVGA